MIGTYFACLLIAIVVFFLIPKPFKIPRLVIAIGVFVILSILATVIFSRIVDEPAGPSRAVDPNRWENIK